MKVLLDTNIIIHREANRIINFDIGQLFNWIDKLHIEKFVHPITVLEIKNYKDTKTVDTFNVKLDSYNKIKYILELAEPVKKVSNEIDVNENDLNDTLLLNEIFLERIDILISEDKKIHTKARLLGISDKVFKIQSFLEKVTSENPELVDYKVLSVKKTNFGEIDLKDSFFDSFREDYKEFDKWFLKKSDNECYICHSDNNLTAFLFIKIEEIGSETYSDITPRFEPKKRLKIGTLKVISNGYKIGERFLKIIFDNALQYKVSEIYVTIFEKRSGQFQLIEMLINWGFEVHGHKITSNGAEVVLTRKFGKELPVSLTNPKNSFPFISRETRKYIVKIKPKYHTELFPDSINTREDNNEYIDNEPHRNRIGKVYISHSQDRHLNTGDILIIYRMGETSPKRYSSTVTSICIVEKVYNNINSFEELYTICNRRTMIKKGELEKWWNKFPNLKPFVVKFLFAHSFPTPKPTLNDLNKIGVIPDIMNMPLGFIEINNTQFNNLIKFAYKPK